MRNDHAATLSISGWVLFIASTIAHADAPAFDRPGIAFSPSTLGAAGAFAIEQGLPDYQRVDADGIRSATFTADTTFRVGLGATLEMQITGSLWNRLNVRAAGIESHINGAGDNRLALKWAPPLSIDNTTLAVLGSATLDTGSAAFTNGRPIYSLGATMGRNLGSDYSVAMYANVDHSGGSNTWTLSPNFNFPIAGSLGGYVEAARAFGGGVSSSLAGAGLTWMLHERVQVDLYGLRGLTSRSPDVLAGFGLSAFWN